MKRLHQLLPICLLAACSLAPDTVLPIDRVPDHWNLATAQANSTPAQWSDFGSVELDQLIVTALANNTDLSAALARVSQARATARIQSAGLYPTLDASGSASHTHTSTGNVRTNDSSSATLDIAYELDLWQRNANLSDSALWSLQATQYDRAALSLLVSSEVARLYSGVLAFDARMEVAKKSLTNAQEVLRITELRYKNGAVSGLEQAQQRTAVANTQAEITRLQNQRELFFNQLAQVVGVTPAHLQLSATAKLDDLKINPVPLATPWELLQRRPDIAAAEARLRASNIDIGVARANALPSVSLGLNAGVTGNPSATLVGAAASFFAPIFEGGALQGAIDRSKALRDENVAAYQGVLLTSFREVEDALSNDEAASKRRAYLAVAADEARKADTIARAQFDAGAIDFTTLLTTQAALLQSEDSYVSAVQDQLAAHIDLMRALGGEI